MRINRKLVFAIMSFFIIQACSAQHEVKNKYGFDFIAKKTSVIIEKLKEDPNSFWKYNEEIDDEGIKSVLIIKKGKRKLFDGYGELKSKKGKIFQVVFYLDNSYKNSFLNSLSEYKKTGIGKWQGKDSSFICFIEDEELKESNEFGFSISLDPCDGSQRD